MGKAMRERLARWQRRLRTSLSRTEILALFPIISLLSYQLGGPEAVLLTAMILPSLLVLLNLGASTTGALPRSEPADPPRGDRAGRDTMCAMLDRIARMDGMDSACFLLSIDDWDTLAGRWGRQGAEEILGRCATRLRGALRRDDLLADLGAGNFGVVLHPVPSARLAIRDGIVERLRATLAEPLLIDGVPVRFTASAGHAALRPVGSDPAGETLAGAAAALEEAHVAGPNTVRAFVPGLTSARRGGAPLAEEVSGALTGGAIRPWFQPQTDPRTGRVTGFEALARWEHPTLGLLAPDRFLDAVADAGRMEALGAAMRQQALTALTEWDRAGAAGITISVNASTTELRSPSFAEQVAWDLDRMDVAPDRFIVEVLETVAASGRDDSVIATLAALRQQGIGLDLDDFGIGQASLLSIRRFGIGRIKIDRSFVMGVDADPEQQALVGAIVSMAREMGLETLAEGVETPEERDTLAEMGCGYLQGFLIGKPMPFHETLPWLAARRAGEGGEVASLARPAE
jgi:EAL domain-containing protein (putative c-di-GMP-specific phosphodiesterase class I)/GGDEF domain-containing protein